MMMITKIMRVDYMSDAALNSIGHSFALSSTLKLFRQTLFTRSDKGTRTSERGLTEGPVRGV